MSLINIRPLERSDLPSRVSWINDELINETLSFSYPVSYASTEAWFNKSILDDTKKHFTICIDENTPIGMCGLLGINYINKNAELYITIGNSKYHGQGYAKQAIHWLQNYAFNNLGLHKIFLHTFDYNNKAIGLYESTGFKREGLLREHLYIRGNYESILVYSILKKEFKE